jgi:hypothetical protein
MGLSLRRSGLNVRVDGLQRRGDNDDACCCEALEVACTCGYEVVDDADNPTTGTIVELSISSSATPSNSTVACWLSEAITRIVGVQIGLTGKSDAPGNQARFFERTFTLSPSVSVCGRSWNRMYLALNCQTASPANVGWAFDFRLFNTGSSDILRIGTTENPSGGNRWDDMFGTCCAASSGPNFFFIETIVSGATNVQDEIPGEWEFFVVSGPC